MSSRTGAVARLVIIDLAGSVVWFPIWWYTRGFDHVLQAAVRAIQYRVRSYGLKIWIQNFFVPMYGQYDWSGRLISVLMRFVVLVARIVALGVESLLYGAGLLFWIIALPLFFGMALWSFFQGAFFEQVRGVIR